MITTSPYLDEQTRQFLNLLWRNGRYAYYWLADEEKMYTTPEGEQENVKKTYWFTTDRIPDLPNGPTAHYYFGVYPTRRGRSKTQRARLDDIAAIGCLFAELDAKDYGSKDAMMDRVRLYPVQPSVIIDSGSGYHLYWMLDTPFVIHSDEDRKYAKDILRRWVRFCDGDDVKDLSRVLRLPNTYNVKPKYAPNYPLTQFVECHLDRLYDLSYLESLLPPDEDEEKARQAPKRSDTYRASLNGQSSVIDTYNSSVSIQQALEQAKYTKRGSRYCAPKADRSVASSVVILDDDHSYHWDTTDDLCDGYSHTPFDIYCHYEHSDDCKAAVKAAAELLGLPKYVPQPSFDSDGYACCPEHGTQLIPSKNGNGYRCETLNCFWWKGDGYTTPTPSQELVLTHEDIVQTAKPRITELIAKSYFTEAELGNVKPPTWLVKGYIPLGEVTVVYGPSDSGKSTFIMDWLCRVCQHYPAMYVAGEDGSGVLVKRGAWMQHYQRGTNGNFNMRNDALDLFDSRAVDAFIQEVFNLGLKVVVIDTLSQCSGAADENGSDMKIVMANLQKIAHTLNVAVIVAHHATKDGSNYRGYSGIKANSYGLICVQKINEVVYLEIERIKNTRPSPKRAFKFVSVETQYRDDDDQPIAAPVLKPARDVLPGDGLTPQEAELLSTIYEAQQGMERITLSDLKKGTKWADSVFYKVWKRLARESLIKKIGGKGIKQIGAVLEVTVDGEVLLRKSGALDEERYDEEPSTDILFEINTKLHSGTPQHVESTASTAEYPKVTSELPQSVEQVHAPVEWTSAFDVSGYGASLPQSEAESNRSSTVLSEAPQSFESTEQATYCSSLVSLDTRAEQVPEVELGSNENEEIDDDDRDFINRAFGNGGVRGGARDKQRSSVSSADSGLATTAHTPQAYSCAEQSTQSSASSSDGVRQTNAAVDTREQADRSRDNAPPNDETVI